MNTNRALKISAILLGVCIASLFGGCYSIPKEAKAGQSFRLAPEEAEKEVLHDPQWGLALSGGGIRSSLFCIGGMKALYDSGQFGKIDVISSVSGGSYAAYWLYANNEKQRASTSASTNDTFGWYSLDDENFMVRTAELRLRSNFVTVPQYGRTLLKGIVTLAPGEKAVALYDRQLKRTYGYRAPCDLQLHDLRRASDAGQSPYLIVNATVVKEDPRLGWADGLIEFTPRIVGNEHLKYHEWADGSSIPFRRAVAISGSAFTPMLKQKAALPLPELESGEVIATDGGASENLGAIALIRRGVKNVIIFDAEFDETYEYGAYVNLKTRLRYWGLDLTITAFDNYIVSNYDELTTKNVFAKSVHVGEVRRQDDNRLVSTVYYVKMAIPETVAHRLKDAKKDTVTAGFRDKFLANLSNGQKPKQWLKPWTWDQPDWNPENVKALFPPSWDRWFAWTVSGYSEFLNDSRHLSGPISRRFKFPMFDTVDQSYYGDQTLAYVGLGYLTVSELSKEMHNR